MNFEPSPQDEDRESPSETLPGAAAINSSSPPFINSSFSKLRTGEIIADDYEVLDLLGFGGMSLVYKVRHVVLQKEYAMKVLSGETVSEKSWRRLQIEAQAIARLDHRNIVGIQNFGLHQVCSGIDFAHKKGIVHRDIKPANIIILEKQDIRGANIKIVDFGIAKLAGASDPINQNLTKAGEVFGSPLYMSPEQCAGNRIDARSDIYSVGCALFESLTGSPPLKGQSNIETIMMHQETKPPSLSSASGGQIFPSALENIVAIMLEKEPMNRYQSLSQVGADLEKVLKGKRFYPRPFGQVLQLNSQGQTTTGQTTTGQKTTRQPEDARVALNAITAAAAILLLTAVFLIGLTQQASFDTRQVLTSAPGKSAAQKALVQSNIKKAENHAQTIEPEYYKVVDNHKVIQFSQRAFNRLYTRRAFS